MLACCFDGHEVRVDPNYPDPDPPPGEVLVAVCLAGVCQTDLELVKGYMGFEGVLGHEFVGRALGGTLAGQRVVGGINCACGSCDLCRRGLPTHCRRRTTLGIDRRDGAFAERLVLPDVNLVPVPDEVPNRAAVFAEPLAAAIQITRQVDLAPEHHLVILGDGRLGQLVARVFHANGLAPTVVGTSEAKLDLVRRLGLDTVTADEAKPHKTADVVVEATGTADGLAMALEFVRPRGTVVLKSTMADTAGLDLAPLVVDEVTVVGSRCGPMGAAVALLAEANLDTEPLVTAEYPLAKAKAALARAADPDAIKVLIRM